MYEYKVLRREFIESDVLESEINGLAKQGWRLISTSISTAPTYFSPPKSVTCIDIENDFAIEEPPKSIQRCGDRDKNTYSLKDISHCLTSNPMSDYQNKIIEPKLKHKYDLYPEHQSHAGRVYESDGLARSLISSEGGVGKQSGLYEVQDRIRKLTPTECERLQGFPDQFHFM